MRTFSTPRTVLLAALAACAAHSGRGPVRVVQRAAAAGHDLLRRLAEHPGGRVRQPPRHRSSRSPSTAGSTCWASTGAASCRTTSPAPGWRRASAANPFGGSSADGHNDYRTRHLAVLDDFPYGLLSQSSEGWTVFKINYNATGVISELRRRHQVSTSATATHRTSTCGCTAPSCSGSADGCTWSPATSTRRSISPAHRRLRRRLHGAAADATCPIIPSTSLSASVRSDRRARRAVPVRVRQGRRRDLQRQHPVRAGVPRQEHRRRAGVHLLQHRQLRPRLPARHRRRDGQRRRQHAAAPVHRGGGRRLLHLRRHQPGEPDQAAPAGGDRRRRRRRRPFERRQAARRT